MRRLQAGQSLILIGARGSGKTTVAQLLAARLKTHALDLDAEIVASAGRSIAEIFAAEGEPAFRDWEAKTLAKLLDPASASSEPRVLSLGGGAVLREENRRRLKQHGVIVWLRASAATLLARVNADQQTAALRPALTSLSPTDEMQKVLAERAPLYEQLADLTIETGALTAAEVVEQIARWLQQPPEIMPDLRE